MRKTAFVVLLILSLLVFSAVLAQDANDMILSNDNHWCYVEMDDGTVQILDYLLDDPFASDDSTITSITVPATIDGKTVSGIAQNPFLNLGKLSSIVVDPASPFDFVDSVLLDKRSNTLICYPRGNINHSCVIPQGIRGICNSAFAHYDDLNGIAIPDSVTFIGDSAFYFCESLSNISIPASVTSIGNYAFYYCTNLTSVTISGPITSIGISAFLECNVLTQVILPDTVTSIGDWAFYDCYQLNDITLPASLTSIGDHAFESCESLTSLSLPASITFIGQDAFDCCPNLTLTVTPNSYAEQYCKDNDLPYTY